MREWYIRRQNTLHVKNLILLKFQIAAPEKGTWGIKHGLLKILTVIWLKSQSRVLHPASQSPLFRSVMNSRFRFRSCEEHLQPHLLATDILFFWHEKLFFEKAIFIRLHITQGFIVVDDWKSWLIFYQILYQPFDSTGSSAKTGCKQSLFCLDWNSWGSHTQDRSLLLCSPLRCSSQSSPKRSIKGFSTQRDGQELCGFACTLPWM